MEEFDLVVVGAGSGLTVSSAAAERGWRVAVIEEGPFGGTCLNRGCIPSKMLIHVADVAETIRESGKFGIRSRMLDLDFPGLVKQVSSVVDSDAKSIERGNKQTENITVIRGRARFTGERTLQIGKRMVRGKRVVIAAGTRPAVPPVPGLNKTPYLTSTEALRLQRLPKSMIVMGGGYIAAELAHFFGSLGTKITVLQRNVRLLPDEDWEIADAFTASFSEKYPVHLGHAVEAVSYSRGKFRVTARPKQGGKEKVFTADEMLVATGRVPNTDILDVQKAGVQITQAGFVRVNYFLETTAKNVWAMGDIAGIYLFKHSANLEANYLASNLLSAEKHPVDYTAMPHAVFSSPQVAGVGFTEEQLKEKKIPYVKARYDYSRTGMGAALRDETSFVKAFADPLTHKILGCHIIGPEASTLIHEVVVAMRFANHVGTIVNSVHVHPALSEVVQRAFASLPLHWPKQAKPASG